MSLKLAARLVVFPPYKIADLQENDTATHELDLTSILPPGCIAILIQANRISGAGNFRVYPMNNTTYVSADTASISLVPLKNRILKWANTTANDDWDIKLFGYFVQKRTR